MATEGQKRNIVIVGGGIIGCTTAYFLTRHPLYNPALHKITILEATSIASGASGKAGGLLALWAYPSCIVPLSYRLHAQLATEHGGDKRWGYRKVYCGSISANARLPEQKASNGNGGKDKEWTKLPKIANEGKRGGKKNKLPAELNWFVPEQITGYSEMGTPETTAQVHPYQFTTSMAELAQEKGVEVIYGSVTSIDRSSGSVKSISYTEKESKDQITLDSITDVIVSAGPWTSHILPEAPISAMRAHSVCIKAPVSNYAVFTDITLPSGFHGSAYRKSVTPEMYARPDGTVYACGEGDTLIDLPTTSDLVQCDEKKCQEIIDYCGAISDEMRDGEVVVKQACYLPSVASGGGPLIGRTETKGLWVATGHTCWGIQNSCATGLLMSEFLFEGKAKSANVGSLDPRHFM